MSDLHNLPFDQPWSSGDGSHQPVEPQQSWAVSYSDMITQLLVFFVVIISVSNISTVKFDQVQKSIRGEHQAENTLDKLENELNEILARKGLADFVSVVHDDDGIMMVIKDSLLFSSGDAAISDDSHAQLSPVFEAFRDIPNIYKFAIEGHTDDVPVEGGKYGSNWALSSARALEVIPMFTDHGISQDRLSIRAFGEHKPMFPNRDSKGNPIEENRQKNRRVVIRVK